MKKSFYKNTNNLIKKRNQNIINIDNKNIIKYNEGKSKQEKKDFQLNKYSIINNFNQNINNKPRQIKTAKGSPLSINNKILNQISKITTKHANPKIDKIPTVIFNINSNQIIETNYKNIRNLNESKSNNKSKSKSKSSENNNIKKTSNQCNLIKKYNKKENNINSKNIIKTKTQMKKSNNNNLNKNIINKNQVKENNSYKTNNPYHFYYNNQKLNIGTSLSLTSNKNNLAGMQYIHNLINKNNINNYRTTPITTKNSKEKNISNSNTNHKKDNSNDNKKNSMNGKIVSMGPKKKIQQKLIIQNINLKTLMKKFSISNINKGKKMKKDFKHKNNENISNSKNITLIGKNSGSNLSLNNFYSINILSKSFANSKKNFKNNINFYKTKVETKIQSNNNEFQKKFNKYFENINNHNIFPITISHYKYNYINS